MASKGKAVMASGKDSSGNQNRGLKRKNRDVLQFFEDAAVDSDGNDDSDGIGHLFDDDDFLNDYNEVPDEKCGTGKSDQVPFFPKEEELSGDELEKMLEERYRTQSGFVRYAEDDYETKRSVDRSFPVASVGEPIIWKVKCKVGREKNVVFCLIQKYVDLKVLGTKLQIISAFAVEHVKGFVFVEAAKQSDVTEACNQLADVYVTLVTRVPTNEFGQLLNVRRRHNEIKEGTWARVKNGIYRGDLAHVVAVNNERKKATVKLIPRIDLQALTEKYGGGAILKRTKRAIPVARLISSRDLEEFRPLVQYRRDRDVGQVFEFLDGLMLKDGFLYKKVSIDSLAFWDVNPSEDELQKFSLPSHDDSDNLEWLSKLYGEQKKKTNVKISKGGGKGEGSSGSNEHSSFEVHDLVLFGKRDFGMVIGMEKDESYKILKDGPGGPVVLALGQKELKYVPLEKKFTALDHRMKTISVNDTVKILDGPVKGRQGLVKQIYRGIVFLFDESDLDNAYFCSKSQMSERVKYPDPACHGKDEGCPSTFEDVPSSPKSPLSPKKPWQMRDDSDERRDKSAMLSVGQPLRIRTGPLKGYLCRVLAVRYSDVTVKLDSQQKVLTVKREHLSEVRDKSSAQSMSDNPELGPSFKPFDLLGAEGGGNDWLQGASGSVDDGGWNVGSSSERSSWPAASSWGSSFQAGATDNSLPGSVDNDSGKDDAAWVSKVHSNLKSSSDGNAAGSSDQVGVWGTTDSGWGKNLGSGASCSWEKAKVSEGDPGGSWNIPKSSQGCVDNAVKPWEQGSKVSTETSSWRNQITDKGMPGSWSSEKQAEGAGGWNNLGSSANVGSSGWGKQTPLEKTARIGESPSKHNSDAWSKSTVSSDQWEKAKDSGAETSTEDPWGKVVDKWGNKDASSKSKGWGSSSVSSVGEEKQQDGSGGWEKPVDGSSASGWVTGDGWKSQGDSGQDKTSNWKARSFGDDSGGNDSWGQSKGFENDQGFSGRRGSGGRRGRGRDQFGRGRGRGRSFDDGPFSSFNKDGQDNYASGNKGWNKNEGGSSWGNSSAGKDAEGAGGWNNLGSSGNVGSSGWGKQKPLVETSRIGESPSKRNSDAWSKGAVTDVNDQWSKSKDSGTETSTEDPWGKVVDKWGHKDASSKSKGWGSSSVSSVGEEKELDGAGGWGKPLDGNSASGWGTGGGWKSQGDRGQDKTSGWKARSFGDDSSGNDSWGQSKNFENDQGFSGRRGSGGRRGRGRDQFSRGRGRGRSFDDGPFSSFNKDGQDNYSTGNKGWNKNEGGSSWGNSSAGDGRSTWGKGKSSDGEGDRGVWNQSSELQKSTSDAAGNDASSAASGWGQKSWGKSDGGSAEGTSWDKSQSGGKSGGGGGWGS